MRQWLEAGYFKGDLPISQQQTGPFRPLQMLFPDLDFAFSLPDASTVEAEKEQARQLEQARRAEQARLELERKAIAEAREAAERERLAKEDLERAERERQLKEEARRKQAAATSTPSPANGGHDASSQQLKMLLGVPAAADNQETQQDLEALPAVNDKKVKSAKTSNSQQQRKLQRGDTNEPPAAPVPVAAPAPAWGSTPSPKTSAKTLAEIQKEEARKNAILAMNQQKAGSSNSGWANFAAARGGSTAWQSGTVKPAAAVVLTNPNNVAAPIPLVPGRERRSSPGTSARHVPSIQQTNSSSSAGEEFGAKMSPALEMWCNDQMKKLNGTDDLTLVSFCMTLNNAAEIRQYLTAYLGSTPQVASFATEFINKRGLGAPVLEEWESAAQAKKSRKKKASR
jgi:hypothetical protein